LSQVPKKVFLTEVLSAFHYPWQVAQDLSFQQDSVEVLAIVVEVLLREVFFGIRWLKKFVLDSSVP
jgi:hypothetical protein